MAALTSAKVNFVKETTPLIGVDLLAELLDRSFISQETYESIKGDEGLDRFFKPKVRAKKAKKEKVNKPKLSNQERNESDFDDNRCHARKWDCEKGSSSYGYDKIQCASCTMVSTEEAEKTMEEFKEKMDEEQLSKLPEYLTAYDGCYCKNHLKQDFFMPGGWWLGKHNEPRPEQPMLPKGSFKKGYETECKEHFWIFDKDGNKNERVSKPRKSSGKKTKKAEAEAEVEVEAEAEAEAEG